MKRCTLVVMATFAAFLAGAADWLQFRGPSGSGIGDAYTSEPSIRHFNLGLRLARVPVGKEGK